MKRYIRILLTIAALASAFVSCTKDRLQEVKAETGEWDGKVKLHFSVNYPKAAGVIVPGSKAMADKPEIQSLHVAIFGGSGYLKEYVLAEEEGTEFATENTVRYTYSVNLSVSDSRLRMHLIANGPEVIDFAYEDEVMSALYSSGTQDAYWQRLILENGIQYDKEKAELDPPVYELPAGFIEENHLENIPLIRNFAKVTCISQTQDLDLISYALVNKPNRGTIAPYNPIKAYTADSTHFMVAYKDKDYATLLAEYPGKMPPSAIIDGTVPAESIWADATASSHGYYMYERPIPTENPTFLILKGYFTNPKTHVRDATPSYYRVDLRDGANYYAIFRNFRYVINILGVARRGAETAQDAAEGNGGGDVSSDISTQSLSDISDGTARLAVQYIEYTCTQSGQYELKYQFLPDNEHTDNSKVSFELGAASNLGVVITGYSNGSTDDAEGWRTLTLNISEPGSTRRSQTIKVIGTKEDGTTIWRNVTFNLMAVQPMVVNCNPTDVRKVVGELMDIEVSIPKDLPASLFPLIFNIESAENSLTPYNDNLPVYSGTTVVPGRSGRSFYFNKTLSKAEYDALPEDSTGDMVTFVCHFKTNKENSASAVYVANRYFVTGYDAFGNYEQREFENLAFSKKVFEGIGEDTYFSFNMNAVDPLQTVTLTLTGLQPAADETQLSRIGTTNQYTFIPTSAATNSFHLVSTTEDETVTVALSANHYIPASLSDDRSKLDFINPHFGANVYNKAVGLPVEFYYTYVEDYVERIIVYMTNVEPAASGNDGTFTQLSPGVYSYMPSAGSTGTECLRLVTTSAEGKINVRIVNTHYNEASKDALREVYNFRNLEFTTIPALAVGEQAVFRFRYQADKPSEPIVITLGNLGNRTPTSTTGSLSDNGDGTWTYTPNNNGTVSNNTYHTITAYASDFGSHVDVTIGGGSYADSSINTYRQITIASRSVVLNNNNTDYTIYENARNGINSGVTTRSTRDGGIFGFGGTIVNNAQIQWTAHMDMTESTRIYFVRNNNSYGYGTVNALINATTDDRATLTWN